MGKLIDLTNKQFGELTVIKHIGKSSYGATMWECKCSCGKIINVNGANLRNGHKTSCGHEKIQQENEKNQNMIGKKFGRWTVLYLTEERNKRREKLWHCQCECGNEKDVTTYLLTSGQSKSCGCLQKEASAKLGHNSFMDISNERFGKLVAIKPIFSNNRDKHTKWLCKCDCGNTVIVDLGNLRSGKSQSCGCVSSQNEENIIKMLIENNISYEYQYEFNDLPNKPFDFYINNQYVLEYDGQQHFIYSSCGWNDKEKLIRTHKNDLTKNKFCFDNNIPIIRIPYNKKYTFKDLLLESTNFLFTKDNEKEYYSYLNLSELNETV